jgi:cell pole-organizing protein PopZ
MEDILASIRKIIAQDDARERPLPPEPVFPRQSQPQPNFVDERKDPFRPSRDIPAFDPLPPMRPEPEPAVRHLAEPAVRPAPDPVIRPVTEPALRPAPEPLTRHSADEGFRLPPTLASLTDDVKRQMPRPVSQPKPAPRPQAIEAPAAHRPMAEASRPRNPPSLAALAGAAMGPQPSEPMRLPSQPVSAPQSHNNAPAKPAAPVQAPSPAAHSDLQPGPIQDPRPADQIVSPATSRMVAQSIDRLKAAVADDTSAKVEQVLRPMLKEWLDKHLPAMVERIVREEIERIARG